MILSPLQIQDLLKEALKEDLGWGDVTTQTLFPEFLPAKGTIFPREEVVLAGTLVARELFTLLDPGIQITIHHQDGNSVKKGEIFITLLGDGRTLLKGERVALNFLQRLSGIATLTAKFVKQVKGTKAKILDTRKTTPGLRLLERYAVSQGGGMNHRFHLGDAILIKDNHITLKGGLKKTLRALKSGANPYSPVEVEVKNKEEARIAIEEGADIILLDNMTPSKIKEAVSLIGNRALVEASGGVNLNNVKDIAEAGVDYISIGALTHSAPAVDLSMDIVPNG
ncbi:MAG: carboxylating nicotinate-nucleotide diphosphorylase [Nitrospirae bacterium]|nr:carboxylating nicotinate-nucleotide diphosphorylase [Nitrospirota bacterium]MBI3351791.1 carboxylating nicotinate-nucleotide diphosphorylase [Nitrospirota bacterium]